MQKTYTGSSKDGCFVCFPATTHPESWTGFICVQTVSYSCVFESCLISFLLAANITKKWDKHSLNLWITTWCPWWSTRRISVKNQALVGSEMRTGRAMGKSNTAALRNNVGKMIAITIPLRARKTSLQLKKKNRWQDSSNPSLVLGTAAPYCCAVSPCCQWSLHRPRGWL